MMKSLFSAIFAIFIGMAAFPAKSNAASFTTTNLNMRAGPGTGFHRVGVIPARRAVRVYRCSSRSRWCRVGYRGRTGWVSSRYLSSGRRYISRRTSIRRYSRRYTRRRPSVSVSFGSRRVYYSRYRRPRSSVTIYFGR